MPAHFRPIVAVLMSCALMQIGLSLMNTLIPLRGYTEDFPTTFIGALGTAYFGGFIIGCLTVPIIVRRVGHIRAFATVAAIAAVSVMVLPLFPNPFIWFGLRMLNGAAAAGLYAVIESWLNDKADKERRGSIFSFYQIVMFISSLSGQNMLGLAEVSSPDLFVYGTALIVLALIPVSTTRTSSPQPPSSIKIDPKWVFKVSPIASVGIICVGVANGSVWGLAPVFISSQGFSPQEIGWFMTAFLLGGSLGQLPVGRLSDRFDRRWMIMTVGGLSSIFGLLLGFEYGGEYWYLIVSVFCYGFVALTLYSLCVAHINDLADPSRRMEIATAMLLFYSIGASLGPLATSTLMDATSFRALYFVTASAHSFVAVFAVWRMIRRPGRPKTGHATFVVTMPRAAPVVSALDPGTLAHDDSAEVHTEQDEAVERPGHKGD